MTHWIDSKPGRHGTPPGATPGGTPDAASILQALSPAERLTLRAELEREAMNDKAYQQTKLGPAVVDWLTWLELGGTAARTLDQYERDLSRGCLLYPDVGLAEFGDDHMLKVAQLYKPGERRVRVAAWKSFFKWAVSSRKIVLKPTDALPRIRRQSKAVYDLFTEADQTAMCALPVRDGALLAFMLDSGARKEGCRNFRFRDWRQEATVDAPYGMLVLDEKQGKRRQVPASQRIATKLAELAILDGLDPPEFVWYTRPGGGTRIARDRIVGDGSFDRWWRRSLEAAGVRYRNPHMTRHTFATGFLRKGGRLTTLMLLLGHASIQTTYDLYGHLDMRDVAVDMGFMEAVR